MTNKSDVRGQNRSKTALELVGRRLIEIRVTSCGKSPPKGVQGVIELVGIAGP